MVVVFFFFTSTNVTLGFITTICQAEVFDLGCTGITRGQPSHTGTVASTGHRKRGQRGSSPPNLCPVSTSLFLNYDYRNRNAEPLPSSEEQEALPIWGTHRLLHVKDPKVIFTDAALTAALLHGQPFHFGIKHHLIVSTKIISNSQKAPTTCHVQASELRSSWRTGAGSHRLWHGCTGVWASAAAPREGKALLSPSPSLNCSLPLHTASSHPRNDQLEPTEEWAAAQRGFKAKHNRKYPHKSSISRVG